MGARGAALVRHLWPFLSLAVLLVVIVALGSLGSAILQRVMTEALIRLVMVVGLYIFVGSSGILSFGHAAFMMLAAYGSGWLVTPVKIKRVLMSDMPSFLGQAEIAPPLGVICGMAWAALIALIVGFPLMRLSGIAAAIGTFSVLAIVYVVYSNWEAMTGGTSSMIGLPVYVDLWTALGCAIGAMVVAYLFQTSKLGLALRASREDEVAAKAIGVNVHVARLIAFVISAAIVGLGGILQGHFLGTLNVFQFYLGITFLTIAMLVIGGAGSLAGAVLGTLVVSVAAELLRQIENGFEIAGLLIQAPPGLREVGLAFVMLVILIFRPHGLTAGRELPVPKLVRRALG